MIAEMIVLDDSCCMTSRIGPEHGLDPSRIEKLSPELKKSYDLLQQSVKDGHVGFPLLPNDAAPARACAAAARKLRSRFKHLIVVGIGGSALGPRMLCDSVGADPSSVSVTDNVDPEALSGLMRRLNPRQTAVQVISKAGTTAECLANFFILREWLRRVVGEKWREHVLVTTNPKKGFLRELSDKDGLPWLEIPDNIGGRFSVMTPVGLTAAAFAGAKVDKILSGARDMNRLLSSRDPGENPALRYAAIQYLFYGAGRPICVLMPYAERLKSFGDWFCQLWAESLGKAKDFSGSVVNVGPTPVRAMGVTDQHSQLQLYMEGPQDKVVTFLSVEKFRTNLKIPKLPGQYLSGKSLFQLLKAEEEATRQALSRTGRPNMTIKVARVCEESVGALVQFFETATAYCAGLLSVNAFDQPGVELEKQLTYGLMGRPGYEKQAEDVRAWREGAG